MSLLVGNGTKPYRHNGYLLRSPVRIPLQPDQKKIYQIGLPQSAASNGYLHRGFFASGTVPTSVKSVGYQLVNHMINGQPAWLDASGVHDPEYVWYQGAYSTSADYVSSGMYLSEAYAALCGFHFTIPQSVLSKITGVAVKFLNMGSVWAYGPATDKSARNKNIVNADYGFDGPFEVPFHVLNTATCNYHQSVINTYPCDWVDVSTGYGGTGDFRGVRDLWELPATASSDGYIPTLTTPVTQEYRLGSSTYASFKNNGGGWIVPSIHPTLTDLDNYRPCSGWGGGESNTENYWACVSLRQVRVDLLIDQ